MHPLLIGAPTVPAHPYNLDQLISEDGTVMIEQPILSVEEATIHHFLLSSSAFATTLLPEQDKAYLAYLRGSKLTTAGHIAFCSPLSAPKLKLLLERGERRTTQEEC